jgi:E3 ubiquitin-protein ligase MARCH6
MLPSEVHTAEASASYGVNALFEIDSPLIRSAEPHFAALGKEVRLAAVRLKMTWTRLALGDGTVEKLFAVVLGYAVVALILALYLNILTVGNVKSAGRAVRGAVRQQLLVLKVRRSATRNQQLIHDYISRLLCSSSSSSSCFH